MCPCTTVCPHTIIFVLTLVHMYPPTTICVSSGTDATRTTVPVCPYYYVCVQILLYVCPQDASSAALLAEALQGLSVGGGLSRSGGGTEERCGEGKQGERDRGMRRAGMRSRPLETEACGAHAFRDSAGVQ
jgi:hypothetical protein